MRDPTVDAAAADAAKKVEVATDAAEQFLRVRRQWLEPTPYDWTDMDKRAEAHVRLGFPMRYRLASGLPLGLPDVPTVVEIHFPELTTELPEDLRAVIFKRLVKPEPLPRGKGRHQKGMYGPRDVAIVQAIKHIHHRYDFPAIGGQGKTKKSSAAAIVRIALQRLGVTLRQRTIDDIWSNRLRSNSAN
jgi:hypothetical protein